MLATMRLAFTSRAEQPLLETAAAPPRQSVWLGLIFAPRLQKDVRDERDCQCHYTG